MAGNYTEIINRIADNLGRDNQSAIFSSIVKNDIVDSLSKIYRKTEPIKAVAEYNLAIESEEGYYSEEISMPDDFFVPLEVVFISSDGRRYPTKEIEEEEFLRWKPTVLSTTSSFSEIVTSTTPIPMMGTKENFDLDGIIGYTFSDTIPQKLLWKPPVEGKVQIFYSSFVDEFGIADDLHIHKLFISLIVLDVTIKFLVRQLSKATTEIQLFGLRSQINEYKTEYTETLSNFAGYVNRNVSTPLIEPFDFQNDINMTILR